MKATAIVFDFGGVLFDWDYRQVFRPFFAQDELALEHFLQEVDFLGWNRGMDAALDFTAGLREVCQRFPQYCHLMRAYDERWLSSIRGTIPCSLALIEQLKQRGHAVYGMTNFNASKYKILRRHYPFLEELDYVLVSGEVGMLKPDERIFHLFIERTGQSAQACLLIDDTLANIEAARRLGWQTVHYTGPDSLQPVIGLLSTES